MYNILLTLSDCKCYHQDMIKLIFILSLLLCMPVFAGQYEDALRTGQPVCLYIHVKDCKYCKQTNQVFERIVQHYKKSYRFVSIDAQSPYGLLLMEDLRVGFVPFVMLADARRQYVTPIFPSCSIDYACTEKEMKNFLK